MLRHSQLAESLDDEVPLVVQPAVLHFRSRVSMFVQEQRQPFENQSPHLPAYFRVLNLAACLVVLADQ